MNKKRVLKKIPLRNQLLHCLENKLAMPAINVQTIEHIAILAEFVEKNEYPLIAQFSARFIAHFERIIGLENLITLFKSRSSLYFHLDHCDDLNIIEKCIHAGFDSVMFDGSHGPIEDNIRGTKEIIKIASPLGVLIEGEVGAISGVEDGFGVDAGDYANLDEALYYFNETKVDMLALAIGNAHGFYKTTNTIRIDMLSEFRERVGKKIPLVLHGGTGIPFEVVRRSINDGVIKVNYSTDFKKIHQETLIDESSKGLFNGIRFYDLLHNNMATKIGSLVEELKI